MQTSRRRSAIIHFLDCADEMTLLKGPLLLRLPGLSPRAANRQAMIAADGAIRSKRRHKRTDGDSPSAGAG